MHQLDQMLYRTRQRAGLDGVRVGAHIWRHTWVTQSLEAGMPIHQVSRLAGHASVTVTDTVYARNFTSHQARQGAISVLDHYRSK